MWVGCAFFWVVSRVFSRVFSLECSLMFLWGSCDTISCVTLQFHSPVSLSSVTPKCHSLMSLTLSSIPLNQHQSAFNYQGDEWKSEEASVDMTQKKISCQSWKGKVEEFACSSRRKAFNLESIHLKFNIKVVVVRKGDNCARTSRRQTASVISWTLHLLIIITSITTITLYDAFWTIGPRDPSVCDLALGDNPFFTWMNIFFEWIILNFFWMNRFFE